MDKKLDVMSLERQQEHLLKVSRTFAVTIPMLPYNLQDIIANAYLLCRIADTIEDDPLLDKSKKIEWLNTFSLFFKDNCLDESIIDKLLSMQDEIEKSANPYEFILFKELRSCINRLKSFDRETVLIVKKGVSILSHGMALYLDNNTIKTQDDLNLYCYYVAGVVGEFLAHLFIQTQKVIDKEIILDNAISFGIGLQLTNILKDRFEDAKRDASFLPQDILENKDKLYEEIDIAFGHLSNAILFIKNIDKQERGLRSFCLLNVLMALDTLKLIKADLDKDAHGLRLKITRKKVKLLYVITKFICGSNKFIDLYYKKLCHNNYGKTCDVKILNKKLSKWYCD